MLVLVTWQASPHRVRLAQCCRELPHLLELPQLPQWHRMHLPHRRKFLHHHQFAKAKWAQLPQELEEEEE